MTTLALPAVPPPRTALPRPELPLHKANPLLSTMDVSKPIQVKYQVITREGQDIVVGRIKIPTPSGHAFILRRFDTGAISLTTMFRASFPEAPEHFEKDEASWVKANYDVSGANGSGNGKALRLAGTWLPVSLALHLAPQYELTSIIRPLAAASPNSEQTYRKSTKSPSGAAHPPVHAQSPQTSPTAPPAAKRRRESPRHKSPAPAPVTVASPVTSPAKPLSRAKAASPKPVSAAKQASPVKPVSPTKSTLVSEAAPQEAPATTVIPSPVSSGPEADEEVADVPGPDHAEDIAEQKELIAKLKAERAAKAAEENATTPVKTTAAKRSLDETPPATLSLDAVRPLETAAEKAARPVVKKRIALQANQKAAAWGALAFTVGLSAVAFIPNFFL